MDLADKAQFLFMKTVYNIQSRHKKIIVALICLLLLISLTFYLHPTISNFFLKSGSSRLQTFLQTTLSSEQIDPQEFWKIREFAGRGNFRINPAAVELFQTYRIVNAAQDGTTDLLFYDSPIIKSTESITPDAEILSKIAQDQQNSIILLHTDQILLYKNQAQSNSGTTHDGINIYELWFLAPISDMQRTIGFFNYNSSELELLADKFWLSHSTIITNFNLGENSD